MASETAEAHGTVNVNIIFWGGLVKITTVWPFFFVETTRARGGYFDMF
jgi:hypothetical protein